MSREELTSAAEILDIIEGRSAGIADAWLRADGSGSTASVPTPGRRLGPTVKALQAGGATSLRAIAEGLNAQGIPTARGQGNWSAVQVARVLQRID